MAKVLPVVIYPDPLLRERSAEIEDIDDDLRSFVEDMAVTMYATDGLGLAAVQVGVTKRIFIIEPQAAGGTKEDPVLVFINPEIIRSEGQDRAEEGCLSLPGVFVSVPRAEKVTIRATDLDGNTFEMEADGILAKAFQHELDHLDGKLIIDYVGPVKRKLALRHLDPHKYDDL